MVTPRAVQTHATAGRTGYDIGPADKVLANLQAEVDPDTERQARQSAIATVLAARPA